VLVWEGEEGEEGKAEVVGRDEEEESSCFGGEGIVVGKLSEKFPSVTCEEKLPTAGLCRATRALGRTDARYTHLPLAI
jgi:hypothetical protein